MSAAAVARDLAADGVVVTLTPPRAGALDVATGRVVGRADAPRRVAAVDYPDRAPDGRTTADGTPRRVRRFLVAAVDVAGVALPDVQGWTLTDTAGATWTLAAVDPITERGAVQVIECRGVA
jgi:hypothetical protein